MTVDAGVGSWIGTVGATVEGPATGCTVEPKSIAGSIVPELSIGLGAATGAEGLDTPGKSAPY